jgi:N-acetylated-alpha-linked acidic dipeptidase
MTRLATSLVLLVVGASATAAEAPSSPVPLFGFGADKSVEQRRLEARFDSLLRRENLLEWMKRLTARPHHPGSPHGKKNAEFIADLFREWGYETAIEEFQVLFPTPRTRLLELLEPERFTATLEEPALPDDSTSGQKDEQLPGYNAYSVDGDVTGELVYVNYGVPDDYEELARRGVDVRGKIVIARYGGSWRGIKPKVAAERGAIGCILYSDPRDDGFYQGDVYPGGPFKNEDGVQRGSVADMPLFPGDPLTPGTGATSEAERLSLDEAPTLTRIPVLPISHGDALPLLRAMAGPVAPQDWRGALPLTYHLGPGPAKVHLKLEFDWRSVPAYDVIATLRGGERGEQWIVRGNHHDAWVYGANDPVSGLVAMMEEARAVGELIRDGWKPRRTIVYAAWDAEEPGLIGSTEWAEAHAERLRRRGVAYVNSDSNGRGFLSAGGSHTLERFFNEVARDVEDPQKGISVAERARARLRLQGTEEQRQEADGREELRLAALGSGSDYTPFLQHLGIASLNVGFGGENRGGEYHSIYDSFDHYVRFGDPEFAYGVALARTTGRTVLRLANADVLPFEFTAFAETIGTYIDEIAALIDEMREETERRNHLILDGVYEAVADPRQTFVTPHVRPAVPHLNLSPLRNAHAALRESARRYDVALAALEPARLPLEKKMMLDEILYGSERLLTSDAGLPRRPWFKHQIYAPGFYTGYGVKTLPGVREAAEQRVWQEAEEQIGLVAETLRRFTAEIDRATALLDGPEQP